ncbi:hypothetical protein RF11_00814 [Thelohanellus kitauei]|uniref:Uncharacterized protein n=1 Tax=Thelohanellus kitauei TaxID=669202 RepID=A0A0C2IIL9_THEKT|nr:hypothetical protein RF11_00814 [Thelohanellus kitauei]
MLGIARSEFKNMEQFGIVWWLESNSKLLSSFFRKQKIRRLPGSRDIFQTSLNLQHALNVYQDNKTNRLRGLGEVAITEFEPFNLQNVWIDFWEKNQRSYRSLMRVRVSTEKPRAPVPHDLLRRVFD